MGYTFSAVFSSKRSVVISTPPRMRGPVLTDHTKALDAFTKEAKDNQDAPFRAAVIEGKTKVAAH
jgi:hypothetical protein